MRYMQIPCDTYEQMVRMIDNLKEKCRSIEAGNAIVLADCGAHIKEIESQRDKLLEAMVNIRQYSELARDKDTKMRLNELLQCCFEASDIAIKEARDA